MDYQKITTLGELRKVGYRPKTIKTELRQNLIQRIQHKKQVFEGILGYEDTVIPDVERAILSQHNFILLGLRGQAKTKIARLMIELLDEYIPVVAGTELNDDPFSPISKQAKDMIETMGDATPISWLHRSQRYTEKLATPDVSVADLIGDVDPIKAAALKLSYSDEKVIHYGLIPRAHRQIFVLNELPDLQARIQVALFNILQEGDIQIRAFKMRLPLDIQFVFTANPEDYTNRGSIVTPLKDRIESQILTHYPKSLEIGKKIMLQEAHIRPEQSDKIYCQELAKDIIQQVAIEARKSEYVDAKSGVSARLTISALENLISAAELRALKYGDDKTFVRVADFWGIIPSITGKVELVYEGEQEGAFIVAQNLISKAIRSLFLQYFPDPEKLKKKKNTTPSAIQEKEPEFPYAVIINWFNDGHTLDILHEMPNKSYQSALDAVPGLKALITNLHPNLKTEDTYFFMEFALHGLAEFSLISKSRLEKGVIFKDLLSSMFKKE